MKAIIVGGGVMGLSTAWALAREGHDVELFEQSTLPNPLASSMDEHRLIRHPYGDHMGYARLIDDAYAAWDLMWRDLGQRLYAPTGTLALTGNGADWAERSAATLAAIGHPMTELTVAELPPPFPLPAPPPAPRASLPTTCRTPSSRAPRRRAADSGPAHPESAAGAIRQARARRAETRSARCSSAAAACSMASSAGAPTD